MFGATASGLPLPGLPGSAEFMSAYDVAVADNTRRQIGAGRTKPGSINALVVRFYQSAAFTRLAPLTQSTYRNIIDRFRAKHGDKPVALLRADDVRRMIDARAETPAAANNYLAMIGLLMRFAVKLGWRDDDPTARVDKVRFKSVGFHSWTEAEIAAFEARHPLGTKARLALDLMLYTAQRRSDVVRMGRQHVSGGAIRVRQTKTAVDLEIPLHAALRASLAATPNDHLTFIVTAFGKAYTAAGFGNWFRDRCDEASLPHCSAHGLRKAARRLADAGCSAHEIMAITGHKTLAEAQRYTRDADQKRGARAAFVKLAEAGK